MTKPYYGVNNIIWDGTQWVASSNAVSNDTTNANSVAFTSNDAAAWTAVPYLSDPFGGAREDYNATSPYDGQRYDAGNPYDIAVIPNGTDPAVIATHKKRYAAGIKLPYSTGNWTTYGTNPTWTHGVALSYNTTTASYTDTTGVWIKTTLPEAARWTNLAYGNNRWVAVSGDTTATSNKAAISTSDGKAWSASTLPATLAWQDITYKNNRFIAAGGTNSNQVAVLVDGSNTWTTGYLPSSGNWRTISSIDNYAIAFKLATNTIARTTDGYSWTSATLPTSASWIDSQFGYTKDTYNNRNTTRPSSTSYTNVSAFGTTPLRSWNNVPALGYLKFPAVAPYTDYQFSYTQGRTLTTIYDVFKLTYSYTNANGITNTYSDVNGPQYIIPSNNSFTGDPYPLVGSIIGYKKVGTTRSYYWERNGANIVASIGQQFVIHGNDLGGNSSNYAIVTVTARDSNNYITAATVAGTPVDFEYADIRVQLTHSNGAFTTTLTTFSNPTGSKYKAGQKIKLNTALRGGVFGNDGTILATLNSVGTGGTISGSPFTVLAPYANIPAPVNPTIEATLKSNGYLSYNFATPGSGWTNLLMPSIIITLKTVNDANINIGSLAFRFFTATSWDTNGGITAYTVNTAANVSGTFDPPLYETALLDVSFNFNYDTETYSAFTQVVNRGSYPDLVETFTVYGSQRGGVDGVNDLTYSVDMLSTYEVDDVHLTSGLNLPTPPTFNLTADRDVYTSVSIHTSQRGFKLGDTLSIYQSGDWPDRISPAPRISVTSVDSEGYITGVTFIPVIDGGTEYAKAHFIEDIRFNVTRTGNTYTASFTPLSSTPYAKLPVVQLGEQLRIPAIYVGGPSSQLTPSVYNSNPNDVIITVTSELPPNHGSTDTFTFTVSGTAATEVDSTFTVVRNNTAYSTTQATKGFGYTVGQQLVISGEDLAGYSPTHNQTITVASITIEFKNGLYYPGVINTFTTSGTGISGAIVAVSFADDNKIVRSVDGINWTQHSLPENAVCSSITWGETAAGGIYLVVALDSDTYYTSADGKTWESHTLPYSSTWRDTIYLNGRVCIYDNSRFGINNDLTTTFDEDGWLDVDLNYQSPWTETQMDQIFYSNGRYYGFGSGTIDGKTYPLLWTSTTISTNKGDWSIYPGSGLTQIVSATDTGEEVLVTDGSKIYAIPSDISETNTALIYRAGPFGETIERIEANDGYVYVFTATQTLISPIGA